MLANKRLQIAGTHYELQHWSNGVAVAGVDEVGRGALAGPVVAAAVVLHPDRIPAGLADSKALSSGQRTILAERIKDVALSWSIAAKDNHHIDTVNILQATYDAMHESIDGCGLVDCHLLIDGNRFRPHELQSTCIIQGDAQSVSIAAASIIAKVYRDEYMKTTAQAAFPVYGFARHVGYATVLHRNAIKEHGASSIHRRTFLRKLEAEGVDLSP